METSKNSLPIKNILITGANRGLGFEIARQLLKKGDHVIISGRNEATLSNALDLLKTPENSVEMVLMDVGEFESVSTAALSLIKNQVQLDVIINNAAVLFKEDKTLLHHNDEILKKTININCYGALRVIHAYLPMMKNPGRIINLSSEGGSMSEPVGGWSPSYCVSKTMLNSMSRHLAYELSGKNIAVNAVSPGWVKTDMGGFSAPRTVEKGAETIVWLATEAKQALTGKFFRDMNEILW